MTINLELENMLNRYFSDYEMSKELKGLISQYTYNYTNFCLLPLKRIIDLYPERRENILESIQEYEKERLVEFESLDRTKYEGNIEKIDEATRQMNLPCELILYRGTCLKYFEQTTLQEEDRYTFLLNSSTSLYSDVALEHVIDKDGLMLEIHLPANYPGLWVQPFSLYPEEAEVLLPMNTTFILENVKTKKYNNKKVTTYVMRPI